MIPTQRPTITTKSANEIGVTSKRNVRGYLYRDALVLVVLFAVVALFQFCMSSLAVIRTFVADQYRPLFNAAFNLAVPPGDRNRHLLRRPEAGLTRSNGHLDRVFRVDGNQRNEFERRVRDEV
jgi:hypothetical protein